MFGHSGPVERSAFFFISNFILPGSGRFRVCQVLFRVTIRKNSRCLIFDNSL